MLRTVLAFSLLCGSSVFAKNCDVVVEGNDAMQFNTKEIRFDKSCKDVTITLKHVGKLPKEAMGHNLLIVKTADMTPVSTEGMKAGKDNDYTPKDDKRIIAHIKLLGGGEEGKVTFPLKKLDPKESWSFFCSFPGHVSVMSGKITIN